MKGNVGLKPGWTRVNFHFLHTDAEVGFICRAVRFIADHGVAFLPLYGFDIHSGAWKHREFSPAPVSFGLDFSPAGQSPLDPSADLDAFFDYYFAEAENLAQSLARKYSDADLSTTEQDLIPFLYSRRSEEPGP
jgi:hypothetical protein